MTTAKLKCKCGATADFCWNENTSSYQYDKLFKLVELWWETHKVCLGNNKPTINFLPENWKIHEIVQEAGGYTTIKASFVQR